MNWMRYIAVALINAFGVVVGIILVPAPSTLAQSSPTDLNLEYRINDSGVQFQGFEAGTNGNSNTETTEVTPKSLEELYQLQDLIKAELKKVSSPPDINSNLEVWQYQLQLKQYETLVKANRQVEAQIKFEEKTLATWNQVIKIATKAANFGKQSETNTIEDWETAQQLWIQAIDTLRKIPKESFLSSKAIDKTVEYQGYLAIATYQRALIQQSQQQQPEKPQTISPVSVANPQFPGFKLYGDTNRDGIVNEQDQQRPEQWSLSLGPLILFNNDMPKVEPADVFQKLIPFSLPSKFVDEITQDDLKKNPHYKVADSMIKSFVSREEVCQAFVWILIDSYKNSKVKLVDCQKVFSY